ncbi:MAG TPA: CBS domain-containing protein [Blastocatellia bacterium]|nr:CBS domain-containing protein [Blastocatellia bacterium]
MKVQEVMTANVKCCKPDNNLSEVVALMWDNDCGSLPVLADDGTVAGLVTDRDIAVAVGTKNRLPSDIKVGEVMTRRVFGCAPDDDIHTALKTMRRDHVRRLPVIDEEGRLRGILSMNDVALHSQKFDGHKTPNLGYDDVVNTFKAICEHRHLKESLPYKVASAQ